ncbi:hypothetical protein TNCV_4036031 [Trichonephila clavipes]|nr:hypothetical protein TNCV_4036031 [Trichonephila clavipes]
MKVMGMNVVKEPYEAAGVATLKKCPVSYCMDRIRLSGQSRIRTVSGPKLFSHFTESEACGSLSRLEVWGGQEQAEVAEATGVLLTTGGHN